MKTTHFINSKLTVLFALLILTSFGCSRDLFSEEEATLPKTAEVFIDGFSPGLGYGAFGNTLLTGFNVDGQVSYKGTASMRFDVPNVNDPQGDYVGGVFIDGGGRDLSGYDALTFWVKATKSATINELGFGIDFNQNPYKVSMSNTPVSTYWKKYIIPIPDASKLTSEKGMFWYAEGPEDGDGYTFWIDEVKYERLGNIANSTPMIYDGVDKVSYSSVPSTVNGLKHTFNLGNGLNQTISPSPKYYTFSSSNSNVATVNGNGEIIVYNVQGEATITASLGGVLALGSLKIITTPQTSPLLAPDPTLPQANVLSIFSNVYTNHPVVNYNGFWGGSTTLGGNDVVILGNNIISYTQLNYVGITFNNPILNGTQMTHVHVDLKVEEPMISTDFIDVKVVDFGNNGIYNGPGSDDSEGIIRIPSSALLQGTWKSFDFPLSSLVGLTNKAHLAQVIFSSNATISSILVDNIYFHN